MLRGRLTPMLGSTRWKKTGGQGRLSDPDPNGSTYIVRGSTWAHTNIYSKHHIILERNPHIEHAFAMRDSFALARLILTLSVRSLIFATLALIGVLVMYVLYILIRFRISAYLSPLRNLPGPGGAHWFKGNFTEVQEVDSSRLQEEWVRKYGHVLVYQSHFWVCFLSFFLSFFPRNLVNLCLIRPVGPLQTQKILAVDPVAISYVLQNNELFQKSEILRFNLGVFTGNGSMIVHLGGPILTYLDVS